MQENYKRILKKIQEESTFDTKMYFDRNGELFEEFDLLAILSKKIKRRLERRYLASPLWRDGEYVKAVEENKKMRSILFEDGFYDLFVRSRFFIKSDDVKGDLERLSEQIGFDPKALKEMGVQMNALATNRWKKTQRLKDRIAALIGESNGKATFVTLTFTDAVLDSTNEETRRRYVARYLKASGHRYVANIDYGDKNGREHYHAVVSGRLDPTAWQCGALHVKPIRANNPEKLAKYVTKLTFHAIKTPQRVIYSRE